jgi:hypothetical protein
MRDVVERAAAYVANKDVPPVPTNPVFVALVADLAGEVSRLRKQNSDAAMTLSDDTLGPGCCHFDLPEAVEMAGKELDRLRAQIDELREQLAGEQASRDQ